MKNTLNAKPRAIALLLAAVALPATPLLAQEVAAPPAVTETVAPPAPAPEAAPAPAPTAQAPVFAPKQEVVQPLPPRPAPPVVAEEEAALEAATRAQPVRRAARTAPEPVAAAPAAAPAAVAPAPVAAPVVPEAAPTTIPVETGPTEPVAADTAATTTTETTTTSTPWMWIGLGIVALAALALVFLRRRKPEEEVYYEEPVAVEPVVVATPVVAAPVVDPVLTKAPFEPAPVVTAPVTKPVAATTVSEDERPWIGLSVWPKEASAGTVQYDLVVENVGDVEAHDVRVSSLIIDGTRSTPMESALIEDAETRSIDIGAGHSIPIAQTIAVEDGKAPHILAEARYPLPGGGEGHIAARFALDTAEDGSVEARLDDLLERV